MRADRSAPPMCHGPLRPARVARARTTRPRARPGRPATAKGLVPTRMEVPERRDAPRRARCRTRLHRSTRRDRRRLPRAVRCGEPPARPRPGLVPAACADLDPATLDAVVISHLHPDHFIDLVPLRHYLRWEEPRRRVRVIGPAGLGDRLDALHDEPGFIAAALDVEALRRGHRDGRALEVEAARVTHTRSASPSGSRASLARREPVRPRARLLRRLRPGRGPRRPRPARRHAAVRGLVRAGAGRARAPSTSTGRPSARWRAAPAPAASS